MVGAVFWQLAATARAAPPGSRHLSLHTHAKTKSPGAVSRYCQIENNALSIGGQELAALARKFGTPLYIYDRETMDGLVARYKAALKAHYPGQSIVTYAGKAFLCATIADWAHKQGLWVDCTGEVEISTAIAGGVPAASLLVHGVNKSSADLSFAAHHAGTIVVDNLSELDRSEFGTQGGQSNPAQCLDRR